MPQPYPYDFGSESEPPPPSTQPDPIPTPDAASQFSSEQQLSGLGRYSYGNVLSADMQDEVIDLVNDINEKGAEYIAAGNPQTTERLLFEAMNDRLHAAYTDRQLSERLGSQKRVIINLAELVRDSFANLDARIAEDEALQSDGVQIQTDETSIPSSAENPTASETENPETLPMSPEAGHMATSQHDTAMIDSNPPSSISLGSCDTPMEDRSSDVSSSGSEEDEMNGGGNLDDFFQFDDEEDEGPSDDEESNAAPVNERPSPFQKIRIRIIGRDTPVGRLIYVYESQRPENMEFPDDIVNIQLGPGDLEISKDFSLRYDCACVGLHHPEQGIAIQKFYREGFPVGFEVGDRFLCILEDDQTPVALMSQPQRIPRTMTLRDRNRFAGLGLPSCLVTIDRADHHKVAPMLIDNRHCVHIQVVNAHQSPIGSQGLYLSHGLAMLQVRCVREEHHARKIDREIQVFKVDAIARLASGNTSPIINPPHNTTDSVEMIGHFLPNSDPYNNPSSQNQGEEFPDF
ncbi:hypothetical protein BJ508DRAFT_334734 [Ascobolus immersus RN42]|uniref:Uncharacterized protein n=1 Tax=Ascobolus immersus RN42 TaxID=1160509 RepID=A0A3N4HKS8_ASCIM|nr:hypothetical protein BJ508DRAFT_334734 [Ascobolus immersus RN42]